MPDARDGVGGERRRSSAQGDSSGNRLLGELLRGERLSYDFNAGQRMGERRSLLRVRSVRVEGKLRDVKRSAHDVAADRRMAEDAARPRVSSVSGKSGET